MHLFFFYFFFPLIQLVNFRSFRFAYSFFAVKEATSWLHDAVTMTLSEKNLHALCLPLSHPYLGQVLCLQFLNFYTHQQTIL